MSRLLNFGKISSSEPRESQDIKNEHDQFGQWEKAAIKLMEQDALNLLQIYSLDYTKTNQMQS